MRTQATSFVLLALLVVAPGRAADNKTPASRPVVFSVTPADGEPAPSRFTGAQLAFVQSWIKQKAPECPPAASETVADLFLEELQQRHPDKLDQLLSPAFPSAAFESMLLRQVAARLGGSAPAAVREELARRRVSAVLVADGREARTAATDAAGLLGKIQEASPSQYRRLVEGRMEDDDLQLVLKKAGQAGAAPKELAPVKPKVLTAADIVAEFSRRNQVGSSLSRLQAYSIECRLTTAAGEEQELVFFKMRPDRFRLVVRSAGVTRYLLAADGTRFWQQAPGGPAQPVTPQAMGPRRYLTEFVDPLFTGEGYAFERLEDGMNGTGKVYRIAVRRPDASGYIAHIDAETFHEVARENDDHSIARYSDFRPTAGVTYAFREEITDKTGRKGVLTVTRLVPNPGLIQDLFEIPAAQELGYFELERALVPATMASGNLH